MGDDQVDVVILQAGLLHHDAGFHGHAPDCAPEDLPAVEIHVEDGVILDEAVTGRAEIRDQERLERLALAAQMGGQQTAFVLARFHQYGPGTVAEQNGRIARRKIQQPGDPLGSDHQDLMVGAGFDHRGGDGHAVHEPAATGIQIEHRRIYGAHFLLHVGGRTRYHRVRRAGCDDQQVDLLRRHIGGGQCAQSGHGGEIAGRDMGDTAFPNAAARADPLIRGVDDPGQIVVTEHGRRQALTPAGDIGVESHGRSPC